MKNDEAKIELIDKLLINEKKSKTWTIISVSLFCLLGLLIIVFAVWLNNYNKEKNAILEANEKIIMEKQDSLNNVNQKLNEKEIILSRNQENYIALQKKYDTLAILFNRSQEGILNNDTSSAYTWITNLTRETFSKENLAVSNDIKKSVAGRIDEKIQERPVMYTLYLQYMPEYESLLKKVNIQLKNLSNIVRQKVNVYAPEMIRKISFNNSVRYFYPEDKEIAQKIADYLNSQNENLKHKFFILPIDLKPPVHQIEIWIGESRPKELNVSRDLRIKG